MYSLGIAIPSQLSPVFSDVDTLLTTLDLRSDRSLCAAFADASAARALPRNIKSHCFSHTTALGIFYLVKHRNRADGVSTF